MRRLLRYTLDGLTALSAMLFVAACVLWVRSHWRLDAVVARRVAETEHWYAVHTAHFLVSMDGRVGWERTERRHQGRGRGWEVGLRSVPAPPRAAGWDHPNHWPREGGVRVLGFRYGSGRAQDHGLAWCSQLAVPHWALAVAAVALPACRLARALRLRRRRHHHQCPRCGYDLRATPGRCPECGAVPKVPKVREVR